jgi:hypothetical protein
MEYSFVVVTIIICISGILFMKKKAERDKKAKLTCDIQSKFVYNMKLDPSIYQSIILSRTNNIFDKMYTILSLKKDFCLTQILMNDQNEFLVIKGYLNYKRPNFYINNVKNGSKHPGQKLSKRYKNNMIDKYSMYGSFTKLLIDFCKKYTFANFYCSYWPSDLKTAKGEGFSESIVYLEGDIDLLKDDKFVDDFFSIFEDVQIETSRQFIEESNKQKEECAKLEEFEKKSFMEKIVAEMNKKSNSGAIIRKRKNKLKV